MSDTTKYDKPEPLVIALDGSSPMIALSSGTSSTNFLISVRGRKPQRPSNGVSAVKKSVSVSGLCKNILLMEISNLCNNISDKNNLKVT